MAITNKMFQDRAQKYEKDIGILISKEMIDELKIIVETKFSLYIEGDRLVIEPKQMNLIIKEMVDLITEENKHNQ
ncbi:hypothetical protein BKP56_11175 [Marinilactibacillus sp. 15R]|uniref:Uncharacterized protein n=1 Tax=Marinilactibacillus piezotolerans TaxID=258723 RepID=A0A1I3WSR2_9LACT|nr:MULTISPECIES: hypothetical protein [Marinilactibacillus]API89786.1 hypothetical protein BKP56_11175 [Marinilactibacillus sp. 15R]SFK10684.1 hypothetical protein SAMN04488569_101017 [Marinilactibacillus piezotolerans]